MKRPKSKEVKSFGGVESVGKVVEENAKNAPVKDVNYDVQSLEVQSETHLEDDDGSGGAAIVRCFEFGINPIAFQQAQPTKQDLFNSHFKGIEIALWKDGLKVMPEVNPKVVIDDKTMKYQIFVGAQPMRGHILREQPRLLKQLVHGD